MDYDVASPELKEDMGKFVMTGQAEKGFDESEMSQGRLSSYRSERKNKNDIGGFKNRKSKLHQTTYFNPR